MDFSKKINQILILCILGLIWGSSFILMKKALTTYTPIEITLYRIFVVFLVFFPLGIKSFFKIQKKTGYILLLSAIIGSVIPYFLFIKAQTKIDSSLNGILNSITPLFTLLFGVILFKQKTNFRAVIGVVVGLIGATSLIFLSASGNIFSSSILYALFPVLGSACYALNINIIKTYLQDIPALKITSWSFIFIGPIAGVLLFFETDFTNNLTNNDPNYLNFICINILGILGSGLAFWVFNLLIKETSSVFASSVTYLIPIVAIFWGVIDGEVFGIVQFYLCLVIFCGIYLIKSKN
ncbi:MAG: DMT family transporter [Flavobacteriales bacterium]|jgi:drug/metabolite transporter (DMT)-like permease